MTTFSTALQVLIVTLGVFRLVRLLIEDTILEPLREKTVYKLNPEGRLRDLFDCPWCLGFWLSLCAAVAYFFAPGVSTWAALPFAISAVVGLLASTQD